MGLELQRPIRVSERPSYETQFEVSERALNMRDYVGPCFIVVYCGILIWIEMGGKTNWALNM